jgi:hypothetical protein
MSQKEPKYNLQQREPESVPMQWVIKEVLYRLTREGVGGILHRDWSMIGHGSMKYQFSISVRRESLSGSANDLSQGTIATIAHELAIKIKRVKARHFGVLPHPPMTVSYNCSSVMEGLCVRAVEDFENVRIDVLCG